MLAIIPDVLSPESLVTINAALKDAPFEPGKATAKGRAIDIKHNLQLSPQAPSAAALHQQIVGALSANPQFQNLVFPGRYMPPLIARYLPGMGYGRHVDSVYMGSPTMRSDISVTLFLNNPDDYEGGELCLETMTGEEAHKLPAGHAIVYDTNLIHRVAEVTRGERLVAVTWVQSLVRDDLMRHILYDFWQVWKSLEQVAPDSEESLLQCKAYHNLLRSVMEA